MDVIKYGTSGFLYRKKIIKNIAYKIGYGLVLCSILMEERIGIMITASHKSYKYNSIKVIDNNGEMIDEHLEQILTRTVNSKLKLNKIPNSNTEIIIGTDNLPSSKNIKKLIIEGAKYISSNLKIIDLGMVTTPEHHYYLYNSIKLYGEESFINPNYISKYKEIFKELLFALDFNNYINFNEIVIDCANGMSYYALQKILLDNKKIKLVNTNTKNYKLFNYLCGTEYILNTKDIKIDWLKKNQLGVSLNGDGSRIIFYFIFEDELKILDGDYISALIIDYLLNNYINLTFIYTVYTNGALLNFLKNKDVKTVLCRTGFNNLYRIAKGYDNSLYFEPNGNGTCLIKNNNDKLKNICNQTCSDGIAILATILFILSKSEITLIGWYNLFKKRNNIIKKFLVPDKNIYITNDMENILIKPKNVADKLNNILYDYNCRGFIKPSETKNMLNLYLEGNMDIKLLETISEKIEKILI